MVEGVPDIQPKIPLLPEPAPNWDQFGAIRRNVRFTEKTGTQAFAAVRLGRQHIHVETLAPPTRRRLQIVHPQHTTGQHARMRPFQH